jgi:RimJ/RimL family protein N-acetyltransferase
VIHPPERNSFSYVGKTITLKTLGVSDAPLVHSWMQENFFYHYKPYLNRICPTPSLLSQRMQALSSLDVPFEMEGMIRHRHSGTPIGLVSVSNIDTINLKAEISIAFRRAHGTRCVAETLWVLLSYVFHTLKYNKVYFYVSSDNEKILRMIAHYDVTQEGKLRNEVLSEADGWMDLYRFCILSQDWIGSSLHRRLKKIFESLK